MRKHITLLLLLLSLVLQAQTKDKFVGNWTADDGSVIIIYIQDSHYYAKTDGEYVLIQMEKKSDTQLYGGTFYDEKLKTEYEAKVKLTDDDSLKLKVMNGLSGRTIIWKREPVWEEKTNRITVIRN